MLFCILYLEFLLVLAVNAIHNVTIDDNDPSITYQPLSSWTESVFDVRDAGGRHMVTSDSDATASFTFTGTAIYFFSPLWTFSVTTQVVLDDLPPVLLDLRDYNQPFRDNGPETVRSSAVWGQTDLDNTQHTLLVSVGAGQTLAVLDTLVYTVLDADDVPSPSSTSIPTSSISTTASSSSTSTPSPTSTPSSSAASNNSSKKGLAVALGVVCTVFALLLIGGIRWFIRRRQRRGDDSDYYPRAINDSPEMSNTTTPSYYSSRSTYFRGRDARFRSVPAEVAAVTNGYGSRRTRPSSSTTRHATIVASKLKNQLTTIPEAPLRETSLARHTSRSPAVQDRRRESLLSSPQNGNNDDNAREEAWTYPQPVNFVSIT